MRIKNEKRKRKSLGFTLVELLIVIALIGILSVAVLATLNPVEQTKKARDAKFQNDAAEVLNALERYYASTENYPFGDGDTSVYAESISSDMGVCGATCDDDGVLITTQELKSSFRKKTPFTTSSAKDKLYLAYNSASQDLYICFVPKAKVNRDKTDKLACINSTDGSVTATGGESCTVPTNWESPAPGTIAYFMCVPEVTGGIAPTTPTPTP